LYIAIQTKSMLDKNIFNRAFYDNSQKEVQELIRETLSDWKNTNNFLVDGIRNIDAYEQQQLKVLVLLGEPYGFDKCGTVSIVGKMFNDLAMDGIKKVPSNRKVGALLWLIFKSIQENRALSPDSVGKLFTKHNELLQALEKAAWVNVKKQFNNSGSSRQSNQEICEHAKKNEAVLRKQIKSISPDLIIVCSNPVIESVINMRLLGDVALKTKNVVHQNSDGQKIIHVSHPSYYPHWGYNGIFNTYKIIFDYLKSGR